MGLIPKKTWDTSCRFVNTLPSTGQAAQWDGGWTGSAIRTDVWSWIATLQAWGRRVGGERETWTGLSSAQAARLGIWLLLGAFQDTRIGCPIISSTDCFGRAGRGG